LYALALAGKISLFFSIPHLCERSSSVHLNHFIHISLLSLRAPLKTYFSGAIVWHKYNSIFSYAASMSLSSLPDACLPVGRVGRLFPVGFVKMMFI
jgi:hypothetical protein